MQEKNVRMTSGKIFYMVYGAGTEDSDRALVELVNIFVPEKSNPVTQVKVLNPFGQDGEEFDENDCIMFIDAVTQNGSHMDVVILIFGDVNHKKRTAYYMNEVLRLNLEGMLYAHEEQQAVVISLLDGECYPETHKYHSVCSLTCLEDKMLTFNTVMGHIFELGKIKDTPDPEYLSDSDSFAMYLKYAGVDGMEEYIGRLRNRNFIDLSEERRKKVSQGI